MPLPRLISGESGPDLELLLAHAPYVRALARELVFDADLARDVEQEAWLAALENAPRDRGALRGWLAALVRNFAVKAWRSSARRRERESACARAESSVPTPEDILERENLRRHLVENLLALDEPYRSALVLRFFEELPPREVARRLGVPVETARTRIRRGLECLRERLDRGSPGGREAWCLALVRGLGVPWEPVSQARFLLSSPWSGVVLMSLAKKTAIAAAAVALGVYLRREGERGPRNATGEAPTPVLAEETAALTHRMESESPAESRTSVLVPTTAPVESAPASEGSLLLRVSWHDGTPAQGIGVRLHTSYEELDILDSLEGTTGLEGTCLFDHVPGRVRVLLDRGLQETIEVGAGEHAELAMTIPRGNDVEGIVVDADGRPVAGADVCVDQLLGAAFLVAHSGPDGRFPIRSVSERGCYLYARAPLHAPTLQWRLDGGSDHTYEVRLVFPETGGGLEGTVRDAEDKPVAGAWVQVGDEMGWIQDDLPLPDGSKGGRLTWRQLASTDAEGRFRIPGVATGTQAVKVRARGLGPWKGEVEIVDARASRLDITLLEGTSVTGTVTDLAGQPVAGVALHLAREMGLLRRAARSNAEGTYLLEDLPAWEFDLQAMLSERVCDSRKVLGAPGLLLRWDPEIDGGLRIRGRVVAPGLDRARFFILSSAVAANGSGSGDNLSTGEDGRFELLRCADAPHEIRISSVEQPMFPLAILEDVLPGPEERLIEIDPTRMPSVRLKGRVLDSRGDPVAFTEVSPEGEGFDMGLMWKTRVDGTFDLGPFPPGRWGIAVWKRGAPLVLLRTDSAELAPDQTWDFGDLQVGD